VTMPSRRYVSAGSFIVEWWSRLLDVSYYVSPHWWLRNLVPPIDRSYRFVDAWVIGHFLVSILLFVATAADRLWWLEWLGIRYGALIVVEGFFYEVDLLLFQGYRAAKERTWQRVLSHRRLVVTSLQNYVAIIFWFALFYRHWSTGFTPSSDMASIPIHPWLTWLRLSLNTMTSFGQAPMVPTETWTILLTMAQTAIGVFMALLIVVSSVRLLPQPGSWTRFEQEPPPYHPIYDPGTTSEKCPSRRSPMKSSVTKESLAMAAAVGAFSLAGLSLLLGYFVLSSAVPCAGCWTDPELVGGGVFVLIGAGLASYGLYWLWRKAGAKDLKQRRSPPRRNPPGKS